MASALAHVLLESKRRVDEVLSGHVHEYSGQVITL